MEPEESDRQYNIQIEHLLKIELTDKKIKDLITFVLETFNIKESFVSLTIADDDTVLELNKRFFQKDDITDVISFDLSDDENGPRVFELIVNGEIAKREAKKRNISHEAELALYIVHGLLHNLGFDDLEESKAIKMHKEEDKILQELGFGVVYNTGSER